MWLCTLLFKHACSWLAHAMPWMLALSDAQYPRPLMFNVVIDSAYALSLHACAAHAHDVQLLILQHAVKHVWSYRVNG